MKFIPALDSLDMVGNLPKEELNPGCSRVAAYLFEGFEADDSTGKQVLIEPWMLGVDNVKDDGQNFARGMASKPSTDDTGSSEARGIMCKHLQLAQILSRWRVVSYRELRRKEFFEVGAARPGEVF